MRAARSGLIVAWAVCATLTLAACGGGSPAGTPPVPTPAPAPPTPMALGPVDPALVGTWAGTINGSVGVSTYTMSLDADSSMSAVGTGNYCRMTGTWGVAAGQFAARGEECQGFVVTFVAPASSAQLSGTWVANGGARGQFTVSR